MLHEGPVQTCTVGPAIILGDRPRLVLFGLPASKAVSREMPSGKSECDTESSMTPANATFFHMGFSTGAGAASTAKAGGATER
mmetsp:Transcript_66382/g.131609  ORF Transcript_66382/g.131609 Transcript_66382/m.131609 type:complete len:83 (-) Transcript_66382:204-452(-)